MLGFPGLLTSVSLGCGVAAAYVGGADRAWRDDGEGEAQARGAKRPAARDGGPEDELRDLQGQHGGVPRPLRPPRACQAHVPRRVPQDGATYHALRLLQLLQDPR